MRLLTIFLCLLIPFATNARYIPLDNLKLPQGFKIEVYAEGVHGARQLALGTLGTVFVGSKDDKVYAITKNAGTTHVFTIASGLNAPNGVAFRDGSLYVAEINRILRYDNIESRLENPPQPIIIKNNLPTNPWHGWRYIGFGYDDKLYIGIGMPCNSCLPSKPEFGTIMRLNPDGHQYEMFAKGIRNTVGFDWDPISKKLWFTDNGRDYLGDDSPPDKLDFAPTSGMNFGFPYYNGRGLPDPVYGSQYPESNFTMPTYELPAHVAALGMKFYKGNLFPSLSSQNAQQIFIAEHGSWNRTKKSGYQVIRLWMKDNKILFSEPFITGWLQNEKAWGRPVDLLILNDGSMLVSDDTANVIYRVTYTG